MTEIHSEYVITPRDVLRGQRAIDRWWLVRDWLFPSAVIAAGLAVGQLAPIVFGVVFFGLRRWTVRRQLTPYLSGERTVTIRITDQAYESHDGEISTSRAWTRFKKARRRHGFWVLRMVDNNVVVLPETALTRPQSTAFEQLLRRVALLPHQPDSSHPPAPSLRPEGARGATPPASQE